MLWGELLALASAVGFAVAGFYLRMGQQERPHDDGVLTPNVVNLAMNLPLAIALGLLGYLPRLVWSGIGLFVVSGMLQAFMGRLCWSRSIRLIGPSRATALEGTYPLITTVLAVGFLSEKLPVLGWLGACMAIGGILLLGFEPKPSSGAAGGQPAGGTWGGVVAGLGSSLGFGGGTFMRKVALQVLPSPFVGAPLNSGTAVAGLVLMDLAQGHGLKRVREALLRPPAGFIIAGVITTVAQLGNLSAVFLAPVSRVAIINAMQPVLTVALGAVFFRRHDNINRRVVTAAAAIVSGVALVTVL